MWGWILSITTLLVTIIGKISGWLAFGATVVDKARSLSQAAAVSFLLAFVILYKDTFAVWVAKLVFSVLPAGSLPAEVYGFGDWALPLHELISYLVFYGGMYAIAVVVRSVKSMIPTMGS